MGKEILLGESSKTRSTSVLAMWTIDGREVIVAPMHSSAAASNSSAVCDLVVCCSQH